MYDKLVVICANQCQIPSWSVDGLSVGLAESSGGWKEPESKSNTNTSQHQLTLRARKSSGIYDMARIIVDGRL